MGRQVRKGTSGVGLVEVVVAAAIVILVVFSLIAAYLVYFRAGLDNPARLQATLLAEEGVEVLKSFRDNGWSSTIATFSTGTDYHLATSSLSWEATTSPKFIFGKFDRVFRLSEVMRDASGNIIASGGTNDIGTRKVVVTVSWLTTRGTTTRSLSLYLTNLFNN